MIIYKLECLNQDGCDECNGYFVKLENAELMKAEYDSFKENVRYGIEQSIVTINTEDEHADDLRKFKKNRESK